MSVWNFENMAFPIVDGGIKSVGITKREYFAAMFMAAMLSQENNANRAYNLAHSAVINANALIDVLNDDQAQQELL